MLPIPLTIIQPVFAQRHLMNQKSIEMLIGLEVDGHPLAVSLHCAYGVSGLSRARQHAATSALADVGQRGGLVLWLDADMVIPPEEFIRQTRACLETGLTISARYQMRKDDKIAASSLPQENIRRGEWLLRPVLAGMGGLMIPADIFLEQAYASPLCADPDKPSRLICASRIEPHPEFGYHLISEDYDYCRQLRGGAWFARKRGEQYISYGHVVERVIYPAKEEFDEE